MLAEALFAISLTTFLLFLAFLLLERHLQKRFCPKLQDKLDALTNIFFIKLRLFFKQIAETNIFKLSFFYLLVAIKVTLAFLEYLFSLLANLLRKARRRMDKTQNPSEFLKSVSAEKEKIHNNDDKLKEIIEQEQKA